MYELEQRAFSGPARPGKESELPPAQPEGDVIERDAAARIDFGDVREAEHI
jgi:hypothetical protein